ncbi:MAG: zinc ribbon domain-containing protein [Deltaproteobacteria bacterium]|nr:zinc ribbon domain-containing protein [Deltaproteobacteria bacterium]
MSGGMAFRKDCEDCGHSFLTSDRKAKFCPRCAGKGRKMEEPEKIRAKEPHSKIAASAKITDEKQTSKAPAHKPDLKKGEIPQEVRSAPPKSKLIKEVLGKEEHRQTPADQGPETKSEILLTEEQTKEIIARYQAYVEVMERPPRGRRKTIAAEMGLPYRAIILTLRNWNQAHQRDLSREERFSVEKAYFSFMEKETSFARLKNRIGEETGLNPWSVSRYMDILHDGEDKLKEIPDVSPDQRTAILVEYNTYLAGSAPPGPFLHPMIGEKIGVKTKQVHKVLLVYRLGRFRGRWS